ncbi:hypothetical protein BXZ70DRAFT_657639 [Cristinia sonorae]|uniref:Uncharacterized protein n=1 Tax=Cristinia sonorae TaxID=1940300 RepID=A0A8K0UEZ4_9AGAR|nr:hypothetical protein BXZ70DRAFT_657639 [Cristinia sonorae]
MPLGLAEAAIISTTVEGMLYGLSVVMFVLSFWILVRDRKKQKVNWGLVFAAISLLLMSTAEYAVNILRLIEGLLLKGPSMPMGEDFYFADVTQPTFTAKGVLYNLQTLVLDGVVIYRCYMVWQSWWIVAVPILGWLGLLGLTVGVNYTLSHAVLTAGNIFATDTGRWVTAVYATTLAVNILATALLAFRIWYIQRKSQQYMTGRHDSLHLVVRIVLESGAIYSATVICGLVTFLLNNPGVYIILDLLSPIICIVFNLIIVRVGFLSDARMTGMASETGGPSTLRFADRASRMQSSAPGYEQKSMAIELTQYVETDADAASVTDKPGAMYRPGARSEDRASAKPFCP